MLIILLRFTFFLFLIVVIFGETFGLFGYLPLCDASGKKKRSRTIIK